jgi:hypothetical protein
VIDQRWSIAYFGKKSPQRRRLARQEFSKKIISSTRFHIRLWPFSRTQRTVLVPFEPFSQAESKKSLRPLNFWAALPVNKGMPVPGPGLRQPTASSPS